MTPDPMVRFDTIFIDTRTFPCHTPAGREALRSLTEEHAWIAVTPDPGADADPHADRDGAPDPPGPRAPALTIDGAPGSFQRATGSLDARPGDCVLLTLDADLAEVADAADVVPVVLHHLPPPHALRAAIALASFDGFTANPAGWRRAFTRT
ncbi:hypothetical protein ACN20G_29360 (plasmid) [Streptomyces sp. BI20]|uniref:hypothetical protein n=1 Tax=Streptomyces sp. BI20 TaxID=3403460 RepID=UPI003C77271E